MNHQRGSHQQQNLQQNKFRPSGQKKSRLVEPVEPGPQLQALIDGIGTMRREDTQQQDLLWTTNTPVRDMTPEEINELTGYDDPEFVNEFGLQTPHQDPLPPLISGNLNQIQSTLGGIANDHPEPEIPPVEEEVQVTQQINTTENNNTQNNEQPSFLDLQNFTSSVIQDDIDAFENRIEEIALDVGIAVDNLARSSDVDLLYLTSVGFLVVVTIAIVSALVTYKQLLRQPLKSGNRPKAAAMAASMMGGGRPARDQPADNADSNRGLSGVAFDLFADPLGLLQRAVSGRNAGAAANQQDIGMFGGGNSNMEISRLSLHYSSANLSEEESNSLINILDRKKYHERLQATRSAEEQIQPSFFEKISTGSNTDSDLRVVRFDTHGGARCEQNGEAGDCFDVEEDDDDRLPKFRKPVPSKHQLTQQLQANRASQQRRMHQQQQLLLFEDFSTEQTVPRSLDKMMVGELYQHKQQQSLQAFLHGSSAANCCLSEDRPQAANLNQSMASTQQDSVMLEKGSNAEDNSSTNASKANPSKEEILEMQRKYYFGGASNDGEESQQQQKLAEDTGKTEDTNEDGESKIPVVQQQPNSSCNSSAFGVCKPLDSIVELNYEASSDEELQV